MRTFILKTAKVLLTRTFSLSTLLLLLTCTFSLSTIWAQSPEKMSYQAVIRNSSNALVCSQPIGMKISILQGSASGTAVYTEAQSPSTNANGLVSIEIGIGIPLTGSFSAIDWSAGPYFIKTETDPAGGTTYTITGTSQLLSVPYALHAKTAETVITETDPIYTASEAANITAPDITNLSNLSGTNTGDQDLSSLATKNSLRDSTTKVRSEIPDVSIYATSTNVSTGLATKVDKVTGKGLSTVDYSKADSSKLATISGTNTGDQDLSSLATKNALRDSTTKVRSEIPNVSGFATTTSVNTGLAAKADKVTGKGLSTVNYSKADSTKLAAISGTNTGDQDLSGLANKTALRDSTTKVRSEIPSVSGFATTTSVSTGLTTKVDKVNGKGLSTVDYSKADSTKLAAISGTNTGDQNLSSLATKTQLSDSTAKVTAALATKADKLTGTSAGQMQYWNGTAWVTVSPASSNGQTLYYINDKPQWGPVMGANDVMNTTTGAIWMDRNLGASQVATSRNDAASYGDLYQWGRAADGHQIRTSGTTATLSTTDNPGHGSFIINGISPYDWRNSQNDNLWQGVSGTNNPCPSGYRLPTVAEWEAERISWGSNNAVGAFASPLKLPVAGSRSVSDGSLGYVGSVGDYWTSTVSGADSRLLYFRSSTATMSSSGRAGGNSVRCLKD